MWRRLHITYINGSCELGKTKTRDFDISMTSSEFSYVLAKSRSG